MKILNWRLVITAIFFAVISCKKPQNELGLDLQNQIETSFDDSSIIIATTFRSDSAVTNNVSTNLLGSFDHPDYGLTNTAIYTQLQLSTIPGFPTGFDFDTSGFTIDSTVVFLDYSGYFYGDGEEISIEIYKLLDDFEDGSTYYSSSSLNYESINYVDPSSQPLTVDNDLDTANFQLRFRLNDDFKTSILEANSSENLLSDADFKEFFKGFHMKSSTPADNGVVIGFNLKDPDSKITLYYHTNVEDSLSYDFYFGNTENRFSHIDHQYSGDLSPFNLESTDSAFFSETSYIEAGGGLQTKLLFPDLLENYSENDILNKAELVIPLVYEEGVYFNAPKKLIPYRITEDGEIANLTTNSNFEFNITDTTYNINLTTYFQLVLLGTFDNTGIILLPENTSGIVGQAQINSSEVKLKITNTN